MNKIALLLLLVVLSFGAFAQSSMRRCTLLPVTDSVGGAIGFKVFEEVEADLKASSWCTYVSNSGMIGVFSRYRDNLPQHLRNKEVLSTVANKLNVGSIIRITLVNELRGVELELTVHGENGEDIYFQEKALLNTDDIGTISSRVRNWLDTYAKTIPYDAVVNGILGEQVTMSVGKDYPIQIGQKFIVKRLIAKKKHPLLKKVVDWQTVTLAEGAVFSVSDTQALGLVKSYSTDQKLQPGDWVRLLDEVVDVAPPKVEEAPEDNSPGTLGILSVALFGSSSSANTNTVNGSNRWAGNLFGIDLRAEGWITRQYFAALEVMRSLGSLDKESGSTTRKEIDATYGSFKLTGGYKYLPIGFFFGPQIDIYAGYSNQSFGLTSDAASGLGDGENVFSGILLGFGANVPLNREYKFYTRAEFLPFPSFASQSSTYGDATSVSAMELELGIKYQLTVRMTLDGGFEMRANRARLDSPVKEVGYRDNLLKLGASFNF